MDTYCANGDWQTLCRGVLVLDCGDRNVDIILQRLDILRDVLLGSREEEVDVHEVILAARAEAEEVIEISQAL